MHRQGRRSFDRDDAVLHRLLHLLERVDVDRAEALARDAELVARFRERDRLLAEPTRFEDASLAIVEYGERRGKRLAAVVELVARGKGSLLTGSLVNQPVQPFAGIAVRANRRVERGVAAEPPVHVDHVLLRDAEPLGDGFDLVMADIAIVEDGNLLLAARRLNNSFFRFPVVAM